MAKQKKNGNSRIRKIVSLCDVSSPTAYLWEKKYPNLLSLIDKYFTEKEIKEFVKTGEVSRLSGKEVIPPSYDAPNKNEIERLLDMFMFKYDFKNLQEVADAMKIHQSTISGWKRRNSVWAFLENAHNAGYPIVNFDLAPDEEPALPDMLSIEEDEGKQALIESVSYLLSTVKKLNDKVSSLSKELEKKSLDEVKGAFLVGYDELIASLLRQHSISNKKELAHFLDVTPSTISRWKKIGDDGIRHLIIKSKEKGLYSPLFETFPDDFLTDV